MGIEIERKFRVKSEGWRHGSTSTVFRQGYLCSVPERTVRVRVAGESGFLTVKGRNQGATRAEFEYPIPRADAEAMLATLCERPLIEKTRHLLELRSHTWEIDVFAGENAGLVIAEVELEREDEAVVLPDWIGEEVTGDPRFQNSSLVAHPYRSWDAKDRR